MFLFWSFLPILLVAVEGSPCTPHYAPGCRCVYDSHDKIRSVNCTDLGIAEFPFLHDTVRTVVLSGNRIRGLAPRKAGQVFPELLSLTINYCGVETISPDFFLQFPMVGVVYLKGNKLTEVPSIASTGALLVDVSENKITRINRFTNPTLFSLSLDNNELTEIHEGDLSNLPKLKVLTMSYNSITTIHSESLSPSISHLLLGSNKLSEIPRVDSITHSLMTLSAEKNLLENFDNILAYAKLENCTLASNKIKRFPIGPFEETLPSNLGSLILSGNEIGSICREDFEMFPRLRNLQLSDNEITLIPDKCMSHLSHLRTLDLSYNQIEFMSESGLKGCHELRTLYIQSNELEHLPLPPKHMDNLQELDASLNQLKTLPHATPGLLLLYLSDNGITTVGPKQLAEAVLLDDLDLSNNNIRHLDPSVLPLLPSLSRLHLQGNELTSLEGQDLGRSTHLSMVNLGSNFITHIPDHLFNNTPITTLSFPNNKLTAITNTTLTGLDGKLRFLDLSFNDLQELSNVGLSAVETLYLDGNDKLVSKLPRKGINALKRVTVPFPVMCCWFRKIRKNSKLNGESTETAGGYMVSGHWDAEAPVDLKATFLTHEKTINNELHTTPNRVTTETMTPRTTYPSTNSFHFLSTLASSLGWGSTQATLTTTQYPHITTGTTNQPGGRDKRRVQVTTPRMETTTEYPVQIMEFEELTQPADNTSFIQYDLTSQLTDELHCTPQPDAFNPCEDLIGNWVLRLGVWIVCTLAVVGNLGLFTVTILSTKKFTPTRFLIVNLSFSDLFTGIYLMMLAVVDAKTYGLYEDYAMDWQNGPGCKIAGFMVTFSSELSVFTLTVISVERMVTIIHYSNPYKHLKTRHIAVAMLFGWMISVTAGVMPLLGFSDYSLVSICLPFQNKTSEDMALIMSLLIVNTLAVTVIIYCYLTIFANVRHLQKPLDNADFRETLRMALIILTDVLCWLPIVVCGVSAAFGKTLITTSNAKILVVFFLPLNACANPFLYSLSRAGFRRDVLFVLNKMGLCQQAYYIASRRKSGMDLDLKKRLQGGAETKELRKPSQDSTSSSGYSSDRSYIQHLVSHFKSHITSLDENDT